MHRPKEIAETLGISSATLRLWSNHFSDVLSPAAQKARTDMGTAAQRRYDEHDLAVFRQAQTYLNHGATYEAALRRLQAEPIEEVTAEDLPLPRTTDTAIALTAEHPILLAFRQALEAKNETIRVLEARVRELAAAKNETIATLQLVVAAKEKELETFHVPPTPAPAPTPPTRFRWGFLNKLLLEPGDTPSHGDSNG